MENQLNNMVVDKADKKAAVTEVAVSNESNIRRKDLEKWRIWQSRRTR